MDGATMRKSASCCDCVYYMINKKTDQAVLSGYIKHGFMRAIYKILLWNHDSHEWLQMCG